MEKFKEFLSPEDIAEILRIVADGNKAKLGRELGVSGEAVYHWVKGLSRPSKQKMKALLEMRRSLEAKNNREGSKQYSAADVSTAVEYARESSQLRPSPRARQLADEVYETLAPDRKRRADEVYIEMVMRLRNEQDYEDEEGG